MFCFPWILGVRSEGRRAQKRLSYEARFPLEREEDGPAGGGLLVSAISWWEVAMLTQRGRLALNMEVEPWLALVAALPAVELLPLDPLLSADRKILAYPHVQSLW